MSENTKLLSAVATSLRRQLGAENVLTQPEDLACYAYDATHYTVHPALVVFPGNTEEVATVLREAVRYGLPVVARGAGTSISGGAVPIPGGIVLATNRLNRVLEVDTANLTATVEPGVVLGEFQRAVERRGLFYPPDPASLAVSTLGGNVAESAGGPRGVKYGTTKDYVLSLEVVLVDGEVLQTGARTVKNASGYDLTHLFVGSEGTLGIITKITVRLIPLPEARQTLLAVFNHVEEAAETVSAIIAAKVVPTTLELMDDVTMARVEAFKPVGLPLDAEAVLLIEVDGSPSEVARQTDLVEGIVRRHGMRELRIARTPVECDELWTARRGAFAAIARSRPTVIVEDATVPRDKIPAIVARIKELSRIHKVQVAILGHAGDGNMHPLIMTDLRDREEMARVEHFIENLFEATLALGGVLSGEHGIGLLKAPFMGWQHSAVALGAMRQLKQTFDPHNILNPGKLIPSESQSRSRPTR